MELDDIPAERRHEVFLQVPMSFQMQLETGERLNVPSPPILTYHTSLAKHGSDEMRESIYNIAMTEYLAYCLLAFLDGALQGLRPGRWTDARAFSGFPGAPAPGRLTWLPDEVRNSIERLGFFDLVAETNHPPIEAWLAWHTSTCIDWTHGPGFWNYHFGRARVLGVNEYVDERGATYPAAAPRLRHGAVLPTRSDASAALRAWVEWYGRDRLNMQYAGPWPTSGPNRPLNAKCYEILEDPRAAAVEPREDPEPYEMPPRDDLRGRTEGQVNEPAEPRVDIEEVAIVEPVPMRAAGEGRGGYPSRVSYPPRAPREDNREEESANSRRDVAELEALQAVCRAADSRVPRTVRDGLALARRLVDGEHATNRRVDVDVEQLRASLRDVQNDLAASARAVETVTQERNAALDAVGNAERSQRAAEESKYASEEMLEASQQLRRELEATLRDEERSTLAERAAKEEAERSVTTERTAREKAERSKTAAERERDETERAKKAVEEEKADVERTLAAVREELEEEKKKTDDAANLRAVAATERAALEQERDAAAASLQEARRSLAAERAARGILRRRFAERANAELVHDRARVLESVDSEVARFQEAVGHLLGLAGNQIRDTVRAGALFDLDTFPGPGGNQGNSGAGGSSSGAGGSGSGAGGAS